MNWPTPPSGNSEEASFFRRLVDCCKRSVPKAGLGIKATETKDGIIFNATAALSGGIGGQPIYMFAITGLIGQDYFQAKAWNGSALGQQVNIAKPTRLRNFSIIEEQIDDIFVEYIPLLTYPFDTTGDNNRQAADSNGDQENQAIYPRYVSLEMLGLDVPDTPVCQAIIFATKPFNGTGLNDVNGGKVQWLEIGPSRVWAKRYAQ